MEELVFFISHLHLSKLESMTNYTWDHVYQYEKIQELKPFGVIDNFFVNGQFQPSVCMAAGAWIKFRIGQVETTEISRIFYIGHGECTLYLLARDGVMVHGMNDTDMPRSIGNGIWLSQSSRADVAVSCPGDISGTARYPIWVINDSDENQTIAYINVTGTATSPLTELTTFSPIRPSYLENLMPGYYEGDLPHQQYLTKLRGQSVALDYWSLAISGAAVGGEQFHNETSFLTYIEVNTINTWEITNMGNNLHPTHIHVNHFQMINSSLDSIASSFGGINWVDIPYGFQEPGDWMDTVWGPSWIRFKTDVWAGTVTVHCHILIHEDQGAMGTVQITNGCDNDYQPFADDGVCDYVDTCGQFVNTTATTVPSASPSNEPTTEPSYEPTTEPTNHPSSDPSSAPTIQPTAYLTTSNHTTHPTDEPTTNPSANPTLLPTSDPTRNPLLDATYGPTLHPIYDPWPYPSDYPTLQPIYDPTNQLSKDPSDQPSTSPTAHPSTDPTTTPTANPSTNPSASPIIRVLSRNATVGSISGSLTLAANCTELFNSGHDVNAFAKEVIDQITGIAGEGDSELSGVESQIDDVSCGSILIGYTLKADSEALSELNEAVANIESDIGSSFTLNNISFELAGNVVDEMIITSAFSSTESLPTDTDTDIDNGDGTQTESVLDDIPGTAWLTGAIVSAVIVAVLSCLWFRERRKAAILAQISRVKSKSFADGQMGSISPSIAKPYTVKHGNMDVEMEIPYVRTPDAPTDDGVNYAAAFRMSHLGNRPRPSMKE